MTAAVFPEQEVDLFFEMLFLLSLYLTPFKKSNEKII
jgi:hypothetical protein